MNQRPHPVSIASAERATPDARVAEPVAFPKQKARRGSGWTLPQPAAMLRREAFDRAGGYRQECNHSEDLDLFLRLATIGKLANLFHEHIQSGLHLFGEIRLFRIFRDAARFQEFAIEHTIHVAGRE